MCAMLYFLTLLDKYLTSPLPLSLSASTTDLSGGFDSGGSYLRKSPDQYSSRGSMESLDHPQSSQLHSGPQHHHHHHGGPHPAYSSCHQLSSARYTQNKRTSADTL